jgi:hypothetical protein
MFAIAPASASLLTTVGMIVPMDPFAPVTRSALGTTGMSGHEEDGAAPTRPWILLHPQPLLSVASRSISAAAFLRETLALELNTSMTGPNTGAS